MIPSHAARAACALLASIVVPISAPAQTAAPLSASQIARACAPPPAFADGRVPRLRIAGAQDTVARGVYDDHDLLIVSGGTASGVQLGEQYFVRRSFRAPNYANRFGVKHPIHTAGWVRIVATNDGTSIALVEHACDAIASGDYLEPFTAPAAPEQAPAAERPSNLDFGATGRVMFGEDERAVVAPGGYLFINRGSAQGVASGARFAVYRDVKKFVPQIGRMRSAGLPLAAVGEAVVVSSGPSTSVLQLVAARDAVQSGDVVVPRR